MKKFIAIVASVAPVLALAQTQSTVPAGGALTTITNINQLTNRALGIGDTILYILVAVSVIYIVWNVVQYMIKPNGSESRKEAGLAILYGIIGLFVIVSVWGLVGILTNSFKTDPNRQPIPNVSNNTNIGGQPANQIPIVN